MKTTKKSAAIKSMAEIRSFHVTIMAKVLHKAGSVALQNVFGETGSVVWPKKTKLRILIDPSNTF